jgi:hypothetical protein
LNSAYVSFDEKYLLNISLICLCLHQQIHVPKLVKKERAMLIAPQNSNAKWVSMCAGN